MILVAVLALLGWLLLNRTARTPRAPVTAPEGHASARGAAPGGAAQVPRAPPGVPAAGAGADAGRGQGQNAAAIEPTPDVGGAATADERQVAKITRGLSVGADGALRVMGTPPGSVVGQLHLQPGDVLLSVNGRPVTSAEEFARLYREQGLPTELTVLRDGKEVHRH